jgi:adenylate cyclase
MRGLRQGWSSRANPRENRGVAIFGKYVTVSLRAAPSIAGRVPKAEASQGGPVSSARDDADQADTGAEEGGLSRPSREDVREQLDRVLSSAEFVASDRLKSFLRFVVEEALAGHAERLKAYSIALEVFGRDTSFDPQSDPVVRMEAGKLRRRLERYYLGAGRHDPLHIEIPKGAYAATFSWRSETDSSAAHVYAPGWRVPLWALGGVALGALLLLATIWLRSEPPTPEAEAGPLQARGPALIVLPFENLTDADEYFAGGLTQELVSNLMRFGELRLYSVYGSFLEQPTADPVELSERLGVGYVVNGSVRREPHRVRLIVHLIEARTGEHLWSKTYDRALTPENVFAVQEELAADLASELAQPYGIVNGLTATSFRAQRPETMFAYDCVLRALDYRRMQGREKHAAARACLAEAVRRDPGYAAAWAFLAYSYLDEYRFSYEPRPRDPAALAQAVETARHAVELDRGGVPPLLALSTMLFYQRKFAEADEINQQLLATNPTNPEVLGQVGWRTAFASDWDAGIALIRQAIDRSIEPPWAYPVFIALDCYRRGDYAAALREMEPIADAGIVSVPFILAAIQGQLGNEDDARRALDRAVALAPGFVKNPREALGRSNVPEEFIDQLLEGLAKVGL